MDEKIKNLKQYEPCIFKKVYKLIPYCTSKIECNYKSRHTTEVRENSKKFIYHICLED